MAGKKNVGTPTKYTRQQEKKAKAEAKAKKAERKPSLTNMCLRSQGSDPDRKTTSDSEASESVPSASRVEQKSALPCVQDDQKPGPSSRMVTQDSAPSSSSAVEQGSSTPDDASTENTPIYGDDLPVNTDTWPLGLYWPVEAILGRRTYRKQVQYKVKWLNWADRFISWEPEENLDRCQELVEEFNRNWPAKKNKKVGGPGRGWTTAKLQAMRRSPNEENDKEEDSEEHSSPKKQKTDENN